MIDQTTKTPWHLWVVGILSLLWHGVGANDYIKSQQGDMDYLGEWAPSEEAARELVAYLDGFPIWMEFFWAIGVWSAVAGSVLLLLRSRWAVTAFALSLVGMLVGLFYQFVVNPGPAWTTEGALAVMPFVLIIIGALLVIYANAMKKKGVLK